LHYVSGIIERERNPCSKWRKNLKPKFLCDKFLEKSSFRQKSNFKVKFLKTEDELEAQKNTALLEIMSSILGQKLGL
jgi:hypothetical protein